MKAWEGMRMTGRDSLASYESAGTHIKDDTRQSGDVHLRAELCRRRDAADGGCEGRASGTGHPQPVAVPNAVGGRTCRSPSVR
jgi:hypothetical protein